MCHCRCGHEKCHASTWLFSPITPAHSSHVSLSCIVFSLLLFQCPLLNGRTAACTHACMRYTPSHVTLFLYSLSLHSPTFSFAMREKRTIHRDDPLTSWMTALTQILGINNCMVRPGHYSHRQLYTSVHQCEQSKRTTEASSSSSAGQLLAGDGGMCGCSSRASAASTEDDAGGSKPASTTGANDQ